ncbi:hypothetical protein SAMN04488548_13823 [Gordonia westfalica]|uniref:Uncharacterized protein n=1 Tax=Gordonia westfalica TaxID=158898 RepID=A0A1H2M1X6_9ACTN|nr:hypothetical protein SAMN04488548_10715 [Gordonia westfalica]SDT85444.1 hypothetical protein SAMN04488548_11918 [Gordonia westfalica]SDT87002.1 hypothetical protein SAMN04488548_12412 [Gordonia westfalica]SDT87575.1 hypothetical protein SAMN04488548_1259 [Gordonia westfalica]SDT95640.1 hypothetical protein SAMN04488548_13313 [Gordonia westfalica]
MVWRAGQRLSALVGLRGQVRLAVTVDPVVQARTCRRQLKRSVAAPVVVAVVVVAVSASSTTAAELAARAAIPAVVVAVVVVRTAVPAHSALAVSALPV